MFEIMLLASFVLVTLGQSIEQLSSHFYVVLNIIGSWLFLLGILTLQISRNIKLFSSCLTLR